jgi:glycosyltransferase involved in cell wall biosynthesis
MRIGYISHQFPPETGAGAARVSEMARRWVDLGVDVTVITSMPNRPAGRIHDGYRRRLYLTETRDGIEVLRCWLHASPRHGFATTILNNMSFMATAGLRAILAARRFDVLIASAPPFFIQHAGVFATLGRSVPLVTELRDLWPDYMVDMGVIRSGSVAARSLFAMERVLLGRSDHVVVVTEAFRRQAEKKGVPAERVSVIPNGVDPGAYRPAPGNVSLVPGLEPVNGQLLVGYLGNFGAGQRIDLLVDVAARIEGSGVRIVLAGDGTERHRVERRAAELDPPALRLLPAIPRAATNAFYNACDICLVPLAPIPAFSDTIPSKLFEILACGRPLVASVEGEAARVVCASGAGLVCAPGDVDGIVEAIKRIGALPPAERQAMGARGVDFVRERYDRKTLADRYLTLLRDVAPSRHADRKRG